MRIDEDRVADLLRRLDDEPTRPPRVDLGVAIREARRRRRNRRVTAAGAAALGVLAVAVLPVALHGSERAAPAPAATPSASTPSPTGPFLGECRATLLPVPNSDRGTEVTGGDPDGRWLVGRQSGQSPMDYRLLIWDQEQVREVELPGRDAQLYDVNRAGLAVGSVMAMRGGLQPRAVHDGVAVPLLGIDRGAARAINDAGRIVGWRFEESAREPFVEERPVVWDSYQARAVDLPLPGPEWTGSAIGIDEGGTIVGRVADMSQPGPYQPQRLAVWRPGASRPEVLPQPRVPGGVASTFWPGSFAGGWVTGSAARNLPGKPRSAAKSYPVRINVRTGEVDVLPAAVTTGAGNGRGWMAGVPSSLIPTLVTDKTSVTLPGPDGRAGSAHGWVRSLSDDGRVLGGQLYLNKRGHAVRWTCR
ncbi:hypothetical protein [Micromonospora avicenniae]|uniref:Uncharacterized protein n=1 Tax=Micromonospora avicenniae TaxID=1198245 RepID=A0A1N7CHR3_9ACTN|nr:hypothetical protein [Micromonospora avicenniae]SIR63110.1 hypothetical protein SAMN05444858_11367 [Micromonospora avicenniae]